MRIVAVSYLNTKPFLQGLTALSSQIDLQLANPANCALALREGRADIGLVPIALLADMPELSIIADYCIGALGKVRTVSLFSTVPLADIKRVYLDYQSRTSVALAQLLAEQYWRISPEFLPAPDGFEQRHLAEGEAAVLIGDRTIDWFGRYPYEYDLAEAWHQWQNLPFVFAVWVARPEWLARPEAKDFIADLNTALGKGIAKIDSLSTIYQPNYPLDKFDVAQYFGRDIQYNLDAPKRQAAQLFLSLWRKKLAALRHSE